MENKSLSEAITSDNFSPPYLHAVNEIHPFPNTQPTNGREERLGQLVFHTGLFSKFEYNFSSSETCMDISKLLYQLFTFFVPADLTIPFQSSALQRQLQNYLLNFSYAEMKQNLIILIQKIHQTDERCDIFGYNNTMFTFPLTQDPNAEQPCPNDVVKILDEKSYSSHGRIYVPWFILTPDLLTIKKICDQAKVAFDVRIEFGKKNSSVSERLAFEKDKCQRFEKILADEDMLKSSYVRLLNSYLDYQLSKIRKFPNKGVMVQRGNTLGKKVYVFVLGIEGVGHHMFSKLGRKRSSEVLYSKLTTYLTTTKSEQREAARVELIQTLIDFEKKKILSPQGLILNHIFLNTVFTTHPVNMYSMPWGGPRCKYKKLARVLCNIDILDLAKVFNAAGADLRVVVLKRNIGHALVSTAVNRNFGTLGSNARILQMSYAYMKSGLELLDPDVYREFWYEDLTNSNNQTVLQDLLDFLGISISGQLGQQMEKEITDSRLIAKDRPRWQDSVPKQLIEFIKDQTGSTSRKLH
eukprot:maker-scaffold_15-snap-gene-8.6-mRNA-1 protein AED:0.05 eAED:0.05 QI:0/0/0.5/1/0/0/2/154/523